MAHPFFMPCLTSYLSHFLSEIEAARYRADLHARPLALVALHNERRVAWRLRLAARFFKFYHMLLEIEAARYRADLHARPPTPVALHDERRVAWRLRLAARLSSFALHIVMWRWGWYNGGVSVLCKEFLMSELKVGDVAPDFELLSDKGVPVKLSDFRGKRVVLYFYPKDNTPGCTTQSCGFRDHFVEIEEKNATVLGISPDSVESHVRFKTKYDLPFTLLADPEHTVSELYGVWGERSMMGHKFMGITRSHFVIDEEGKLADVQVKVSPKDSIKRALKALG
jgi:peroxiredoxin Q/BCP